MSNTICIVSGCPNKATNKGKCKGHAIDPTRKQRNKNYTKTWRKRSKIYLANNPVCVRCGGVATQTDHILPIALGGADDDSNYQALCRSCHSYKTAKYDGGFGNRKKSR